MLKLASNQFANWIRMKRMTFFFSVSIFMSITGAIWEDTRSVWRLKCVIVSLKAYYKGIRLTEGGIRLRIWHLCSFSPSQRTAGCYLASQLKAVTHQTNIKELATAKRQLCHCLMSCASWLKHCALTHLKDYSQQPASRYVLCLLERKSVYISRCR